MWLLQELNKATSGINNKSNSYVAMHNTISTLYCMKQGAQEANGHYLSRFKSNVSAVALTGGEHIFLSPVLPVAGDISMLTDKEILKNMSDPKL